MTTTPKHILPELPFPTNALAPHMSAETLEYHHGKHHKGYVEKLNSLIQGTEFEAMPLEDILRLASGPVFNNAAQHWNHSFFWRCLSPGAIGPRDGLLTALESEFGSIEEFYKKFAKASMDVFGSGWAWLVLGKNERLSIETTTNGDTPLRSGALPLLTWDLWEHAYYIDHRNERAKYLETMRAILNWDFAARNFASRELFLPKAA